MEVLSYHQMILLSGGAQLGPKRFINSQFTYSNEKINLWNQKIQRLKNHEDTSEELLNIVNARAEDGDFFVFSKESGGKISSKEIDNKYENGKIKFYNKKTHKLENELSKEEMDDFVANNMQLNETNVVNSMLEPKLFVNSELTQWTYSGDKVVLWNQEIQRLKSHTDSNEELLSIANARAEDGDFFVFSKESGEKISSKEIDTKYENGKIKFYNKKTHQLENEMSKKQMDDFIANNMQLNETNITNSVNTQAILDGTSATATTIGGSLFLAYLMGFELPIVGKINYK